MKVIELWDIPLIVHWLDAAASFGINPEEASLVEQRSIGWAYLGEDKGMRVMALVHNLNENNKGEVTTIPACLIVRIETLRRQVVWEGETLKEALGGQDGNEREVVTGSKKKTSRKERG